MHLKNNSCVVKHDYLLSTFVVNMITFYKILIYSTLIYYLYTILYFNLEMMYRFTLFVIRLKKVDRLIWVIEPICYVLLTSTHIAMFVVKLQSFRETEKFRFRQFE